MSEETTPARETTVQLLQRAREGHGDALNQLFARLLPRLTAFAAGRVPVRARGEVDTNDLVQDVVLKTVEKVPGFEPQWDGALFAYLRSAVLNRTRDLARRANRRDDAHQAVGAPPTGPAATPLEQLVTREGVERYETALAALPALDRELVVSRLEMHLSYREIAAALGKPSDDAARMAVKRALRKLAEAMGPG